MFDVGRNNGRQGLLDRCLRDKTIRIILITLNYNKFKRTIRNNAKKKKTNKIKYKLISYIIIHTILASALIV